MEDLKFDLLKAEDIDVRFGNVCKDGYTLLLYKNARVDMQMLDKTVGKSRWQRKHYELKGNMYCSVGIKFDNEWVWKDDCGTESQTEKEKGEASDSFKRACFNWGIGVELYSAPVIIVPCETKWNSDKNKWELVNSKDKYRTFYVKHISYNDNREIEEIIIGEQKRKNVILVGQQDEIVGGSFVLNGGKHDGETIDNVIDNDIDYIYYCLENAKNKLVKLNMEKALKDKGLKPATVEI